MRRILLVLVVISAFGLFVARADDFNMTADDVGAFSSPVSLTIPTTTTIVCGTPEAILPTIILRTLSGQDVLSPIDEPVEVTELDALESSRPVGITTGSNDVDDVTDPSFFDTWGVVAPAPCGYRLDGVVQLFMRATWGGSNLNAPQVRARMYVCEPDADAHSLGDDCAPIGGGSAGGWMTQGTGIVNLNLGIVTVDVPAGKELRLKAITYRPVLPAVGSTPRFRWGLTSTDLAGVSRLTVSPVPP